MASPQVTHHIHGVAREGSAPEASEDAAAVQADAGPVRAAVADGATESVYAGRWARLLVEHFVATDGEPGTALSAAAARAQTDWQAAVRDEAAEQPWYVQSKVTDGAFATVLGLSIDEDGTWRAVSVGDCGLFHLRAGTTLRAWPETDPDAFSNRPALLSSRSDRPMPSPARTTGTWTPGDTFLLATDAVAAWLLRVGPHTVPEAEGPFATAVAHARAEGTLRNDDATLLILELRDAPADGE